MADVAFQLSIERVPYGADLGSEAYGALPTPFVFISPVNGHKYWLTSNILDLDGAQPGEEIEIKVVRDGSDPNNTTTSPATALILSLSVPLKGVTPP